MQIETLHKDGLHATSELVSKSIYITNLSRDATVEEIEKGLKKFGPIKRDGIQVIKQKRGKCFAFVEFESATSRQLAIEASPVMIGKIEAQIAGKTSTVRKTSTGNHSGYPEEDYASNPAPVREEEIATPVREEEIATPVREEEIVTPVQEEETVIPVREEEIATPVQEEETVTLQKDGLHATSELVSKSIHVTNLPRDATVQELEKGLKQFGPIKRDGIQVIKQKRGKCFAFVEFVSATSQQRAIEASPFVIGRIEAHIAGKTSTRNHPWV